jgi:hypothetical protein
MGVEYSTGKPRFVARVDVDVMLKKCPSIAALAELEMKLASLTAKASRLTGLHFAVSDAHARDVLMDGGTAELVPPRVFDEPPPAPREPVDGAAALLPPPEPPLPPIKLKAVERAVRYSTGMRAITGEEWSRVSGGRLPSVDAATGHAARSSVQKHQVSTVVHGTCTCVRHSKTMKMVLYHALVLRLVRWFKLTGRSVPVCVEARHDNTAASAPRQNVRQLAQRLPHPVVHGVDRSGHGTVAPRGNAVARRADLTYRRQAVCLQARTTAVDNNWSFCGRHILADRRSEQVRSFPAHTRRRPALPWAGRNSLVWQQSSTYHRRSHSCHVQRGESSESRKFCRNKAGCDNIWVVDEKAIQSSSVAASSRASAAGCSASDALVHAATVG